MHTNLTCRGCGHQEETQNHILQECTAIHKDPQTKMALEEIFVTDPETNKKASEKKKIADALDQWENLQITNSTDITS